METLQRTANRGSISTGYDIDNSLKLEADNTEYLYKTNDAGTNRKTFTVSMWFKRTELSNDYMTLWQGGANGEATRLGFYGGTPKEAIWVDIGGGTGNTGTLYRSYSNQVLRDTSAFYHIVLAVDTTQATEANRFRLWLNGEEVTSWSQREYPVQDFECAVEASANMNWGAFDATYYKMCGYIAECHYLDGVAKVQTDFGEYDEDSGIWKPKAYTGTYGGNGCYLNFDDSASLGADSSGNGNDFTLNNITSADQATDTPTNNFCTINPLIPYNGSVTEGATKFLHTAGGDGWESLVATMGAGTSGKWYAEFKFVDTDFTNMIGICPIDDPDLNRGGASFAYYGSDTSLDESVGYYSSDGNRYIGGGPSSYGNSYARTNIMSIAVDMDNGKLYFAKDGVWQNSGDPTSGATGTGALDVRGATKPQSLGASNYYSGEDILANYGGYTTISISSAATDANGYGTFEFAPPTGYYALCTKNLAEFG
jgi:hypothetical protein